ncbi:MAG: YkgJ family cysteine cluster protein [Promethearchaeota archaeon]
MDETLEEELTEAFNNWLDANMEIFGMILEEWEDGNYVKPVPGAQVEFRCNDCGKCCNFEDHAIWVYPFDMVKWLQELTEERNIPLFFSALFPVADLDDITGYGLPSQEEISTRYQEMIKKNRKDPMIVKTLTGILKNLKRINPSFDPSSQYCIYYNSHPQGNTGHCLIYNHRPIQCRAYPHDYPQFSQIVIPGITETENPYDLPMCPPETFSGGLPSKGVKINEDQLEDVTIEKANYKTSAVLQDWSEESADWKEIKDMDLSDLLLQLFYREIQYLDRDSRKITSEGKPSKTYVAAKRPTQKKKR